MNFGTTSEGAARDGDLKPFSCPRLSAPAAQKPGVSLNPKTDGRQLCNMAPRSSTRDIRGDEVLCHTRGRNMV